LARLERLYAKFKNYRRIRMKKILISFVLGLLLSIAPIAAFPKAASAIVKTFSKTIKTNSSAGCEPYINFTIHTPSGSYPGTCFNTGDSRLLPEPDGSYYCFYSCIVW
jgi:hypothetical protein